MQNERCRFSRCREPPIIYTMMGGVCEKHVEDHFRELEEKWVRDHPRFRIMEGRIVSVDGKEPWIQEDRR